MRYDALKPSISLGALAIGLCLASAPAFAQEAQPTTPPADTAQSPVEATPTPSEQTGQVQPTVLAAEPESTSNTVVVTGSRIRRPDFDTANPVVSIGSETFESSGTTNLTDFLTGYPALQGSSTSADNSGDSAGIGATGLNLLNLRNLGTERTLVLVDGRRHVASVAGSQAIDINSIPSDLVERIDVLTGGASAIYGADGVSGVVNFVMKDHFEGLTARVQDGISQHGDAGQRSFSITAGTDFAGSRGNVAIAFERGVEDRLETRDRARLRGTAAVGFFRNPDDPENFSGYDGPVDNGIPDYVPLNDIRYYDTSREGGVDVDFDGFPDYIVSRNGAITPFNPGNFVPDFYQQGGNATLVSDYGNDLLPRNKRNIINLIAHYDVSPALTFFAEGKFAQNKSFSLSQPTFHYYLYMPADNAYLPPELSALSEFGDALITRDNFDFGQRGEDITRKIWRTVVGAKGDLGDHANYEISLNYGQSKATNHYIGNILNDRFFAALDAVIDPSTGNPTCRINLDPTALPYQPYNDVPDPTTYSPGECVPLNLFGEGSPSTAALDFITTDTVDRSKLTQKVLSASLAGDLGKYFSFPGGGVLGFAVGAEYRKEKSSFIPDPLAAQGLTFGNSLSADRGHFDVKEVFGELRAPVLTDVPLAYRLEFGAALRLSDYSTIGRTTAWKIDAAYAPIKDIRLVGTYSTAVRAPNIGELFAGDSQTFLFIDDPCNVSNLQNGTSTRAANCATLLTALGVDPTTYTDGRSFSIPGVIGSNSELSEETARTLTVGTILQPRFIRGLTARIDWYDIKLKNAVNTASVTALAGLCVDAPTTDNQYCDLLTREAGSGEIVDYTLRPFNVAQFRTKGIDLNLNYRLRTSNMGNFSLNVVGNRLKRLEFISVPGADVTKSVGDAFAPKYTVNSDLTWNKGALTLNYGLLYFSKTSRFGTQDTDVNPDIVADQYKFVKEHWQHDAYAKFQVSKQFEVYGGVNNLFNQQPDIGTSTYPVSSVGRFFYAGARVKLGAQAK